MVTGSRKGGRTAMPMDSGVPETEDEAEGEKVGKGRRRKKNEEGRVEGEEDQEEEGGKKDEKGERELREEKGKLKAGLWGQLVGGISCMSHQP